MEKKTTKEAVVFDITKVFKALADPVRLTIVRGLLADKPGSERHCSTFELSVTRATRSHHFKVLREAGLIRVVDKGNTALAVLCWDEIEKELPGLITLINHTNG
ncbi:helix-turn-helix transcriptional regulator [Salmonella enterica]|uniref:ArsR family transcriptional regulator n=2 Tax=Salmonella enterica I TaxID=59201 RepID=A0A3V2Y5Q7_SALNE|nr:helix-turn-helix domain-containing protein [Salmonella enterica]EBW9774959.1 ArsR family transcriptional regulator [Salmonella enterica subsp. enterica serovar Bovismorbificans]ECH8274380.1 ArsR family transcriptional regulator [Salmonella enterica subsp. enterica]EEH1859318.1 helix-turn-helix transcriptional regulator [Salmonella enterica subsp. houtenae serovar 50:g,z51:-]EAA7395819.1 ArsR family transcriptional regulator [Salmonella enterica subsp. enterica serovar Newport]EAC1115707.1 A